MTDIHVHNHYNTDPEVLRRLGDIGRAQTAIFRLLRELREDTMTDFAALEAAVSAATTAENSGTVAIQGLVQSVTDLTAQLNLNAGDQAKVDAFVAQLNAATPGLAAAIPANTTPPAGGTDTTAGGQGGDTLPAGGGADSFKGGAGLPPDAPAV